MSVIHHFTGTENNFRWENVNVMTYADSYEGVTKQVPIGPDENSNNFHIRYFRLSPGKRSNKESHVHEHGVIIMHGHARVQINEHFYELNPKDSVFISSNDLHQFTALGEEPLGFLCVVVPHQ
jgi:quercetin dioxygenase-like cupin family protein